MNNENNENIIDFSSICGYNSFMIKKTIVLFLLLLSTITYADDKQKLNIAIIDFQGQNISAMDAAIISGFIRSKVIKSKEFRVIDKTNMDIILDEQGFQQTGCTTRECAVQVGKILNVQKIINGTVSKLLGVYYITANCIDVETGEIEYSENIEFEEERKLKEKTESLSNKLIYNLSGEKGAFKEKDQMRSKSNIEIEEANKEKNKQKRPKTKKLSLKAGSKSLVFPGWGQFSNKQKAKGWIVRVSFLLSTSIAVASPIIAADTWNKYESTTNPTDATYYYNQTIMYDKITIYSALTAMSIWIFGIIDAIIAENGKNNHIAGINTSGITIQIGSYFDNERLYVKYVKLL